MISYYPSVVRYQWWLTKDDNWKEFNASYNGGTFTTAKPLSDYHYDWGNRAGEKSDRFT